MVRNREPVNTRVGAGGFRCITSFLNYSYLQRYCMLWAGWQQTGSLVHIVLKRIGGSRQRIVRFSVVY